MKLLLRTFATAMAFIGILAGCLAIVLLAVLMARVPLLLAVMVLACWILNRLKQTAKS